MCVVSTVGFLQQYYCGLYLNGTVLICIAVGQALL